jgi:hypothetical protein
MRSRPLRRNPPIDVSRLHEVSNADIQNAILAYQPTQGHTRAEHLRRAREILTRHDYAVGSQIGRGTMATVYELVDYPKYVVKLTYDPTDAALMAEMRHMSRSLREGASLPKGLPEVATVAALNDGLYAIIVERLEPLDKPLAKRLRKVGYEMLWGSLFSTNSPLWKQWKGQTSTPEHALLNATRIIQGLGFIPYDLSPNNIMQRPGTGEVVVSDFGYSSPRNTVRGRDVARLKNPRLRATPHPHFAPRPRHLMPTRRNPVIDLSEFDEALGLGAVNSNLRREMGIVMGANRGLARARDVLARNGFALGNKLGEGTAATVYEMANDPRWVMKITADVTDVSVLADAQFLPRDKDGNLPPGIPEVAGAYDLGEGLYGVMVERLYPLSDDEFGRVDREMPALNYGWATNSIADRYIGLDPQDPFRDVLSAIMSVRNRGFRMGDIGGNNVLKRANGEFVVSDFGYAGVELPKRRYSRDLQLLQNPRRKERHIEGAPRVSRALRAHRMAGEDGSVAARFLPPTWEEVQRVVLANVSRDPEVGDLMETSFAAHGFGEWRRKKYGTFRRDVLKFTDPLVLFRAVNVPSLPSIRTEGVGVYWTYDPRYARDYMAGSKSMARPEDMKILVAVVRPEDVDWPLTIALNIWADTEKEIRLKKGAEVKIISIYDGDGELVSARVREARANPSARHRVRR